MAVTTRCAVHAIVDDLDESELELARRILEEIRDDAFELTEAEERELRKREQACARGETVEARAFLSALRDEGNCGHSPTPCGRPPQSTFLN